MPFVPGATFDVFISYSWADNQSVDRKSGWVDHFERALTERVHVLLGQRPSFFLDRRQLSGELDFTQEIKDRLIQSATMVAVLSPGYFRSDFCRLERTCYTKELPGGLMIGTRYRLLKASKLPDDRGLHRSFVQPVMGFPFHTEPPDPVEYQPGEEDFRSGIDRLAKGLKHVLEDLVHSKTALYIAEPVPDELKATWTRLRAELGRKGFRLLPERRIDELFDRDVVRPEMEDAALTVHLLGESISEFGRIQMEEAQKLGKPMLLWLTPGMEPDKPTERALAQVPHATLLRNVPDYQLEKEILAEASKLTKAQPEVAGVTTPSKGTIYLICDRTDPADSAAAAAIAAEMAGQGFTVHLPETRRDPAILEELHRQRLDEADAVAFYWGDARAEWFDENYFDLMRAQRRRAAARPLRACGLLLPPGATHQAPPGLPVVTAAELLRKLGGA